MYNGIIILPARSPPLFSPFHPVPTLLLVYLDLSLSELHQSLLELLADELAHRVEIIERLLEDSDGWQSVGLHTQVHLRLVGMGNTVATEICLWLSHDDMAQGVPNRVI
jgi:hypothetical protein